MANKSELKDFYFLPLGGAGEIGMNLNLYGCQGEWLMVDLGVTFNDTLGIDIIMPNPGFIVERRDALQGILLTHAHEDHIGAVAHLWPQLRCPLYATPFTAAILRHKLTEAGILDEVTIHEIPLSGKVKIGLFELDLIRLTHSIPEPNGVVITTPMGKVFHTGDWKFDPDPMLGLATDIAALEELGKQNILAMICDSTNAFEKNEAGSEKDVSKGLEQVFKDNPKGRMVVTCFASNVARIQSIAHAAVKSGRKVGLAGRSFARMVESARECGHLNDFPQTYSLPELARMNPDKVAIICTGSQGEGRAALWRMAEGKHPDIKLQEGDAIVFSSRMIPGNEKRISLLKNKLVRQGLRIITQHQYNVHVSGHPSSAELETMYKLVKPKVAIPVHGELRHMVEQGRIARRCGVQEVIVPENGTLIRLAPGVSEIIDEVPSGRLALDGQVLVKWDHPALKERAKIAQQGVICATVLLDADWQLSDTPSITMVGVVNVDNLKEHIRQNVIGLMEEWGPAERDTELLKEEICIAIRRVVRTYLGKKPVVVAHVMHEMELED